MRVIAFQPGYVTLKKKLIKGKQVIPSGARQDCRVFKLGENIVEITILRDAAKVIYGLGNFASFCDVPNYASGIVSALNNYLRTKTYSSS